MRKAPVFVAAIAGFILSSPGVRAQISSEHQQSQTKPQGQEEQKETVTQDKLPEPVKSALKSEPYKNWTVVTIHKSVPAKGDIEGKAVYEVTLTNAQGHKGVVLMNKRGSDASKD